MWNLTNATACSSGPGRTKVEHDGAIHCRLGCLALLITAATAALGAAPTRPRVFCLSPQALAQAKSQAVAKDETLRLASEKLRKDAQSALKAGPFSVVDSIFLRSRMDYYAISFERLTDGRWSRR